MPRYLPSARPSETKSPVGTKQLSLGDGWHILPRLAGCQGSPHDIVVNDPRSILVDVSGSEADGYAKIAAYPCELPIIEGGGVNLTGTYVSVQGIVTRNSATGFGNGWTGGGTTNSNGHIESVMVNNIAVASGKGGDTQAIFGSTGATLGNNVNNNTGTIDFWVDAAGTNPDFHLMSSATTIIGKGTATEAPTEDIGFDPKCITKKAPTGTGVQSWWLYSIDYDYIKSIGGVAQCFHAKARTGTPDIGAYAL